MLRCFCTCCRSPLMSCARGSLMMSVPHLSGHSSRCASIIPCCLISYLCFAVLGGLCQCALSGKQMLVSQARSYPSHRWLWFGSLSSYYQSHLCFCAFLVTTVSCVILTPKHGYCCSSLQSWVWPAGRSTKFLCFKYLQACLVALEPG